MKRLIQLLVLTTVLLASAFWSNGAWAAQCACSAICTLYNCSTWCCTPEGDWTYCSVYTQSPFCGYHG